MKFLRNLIQASHRKTDLRILWPALKAASENVEQARTAFLLHALDDPAWTDKYTSEELGAFSETLE